MSGHAVCDQPRCEFLRGSGGAHLCRFWRVDFPAGALRAVVLSSGSLAPLIASVETMRARIVLAKWPTRGGTGVEASSLRKKNGEK
jgi:hypothetical protein